MSGSLPLCTSARTSASALVVPASAVGGPSPCHVGGVPVEPAFKNSSASPFETPRTTSSSPLPWTSASATEVASYAVEPRLVPVLNPCQTGGVAELSPLFRKYWLSTPGDAASFAPTRSANPAPFRSPSAIASVPPFVVTVEFGELGNVDGPPGDDGV